MRRLQRWLRKLGSCLLRQALAGFVLLLGAVVGWHARKSTGPAILSETLDQRVTPAGPRRPAPVTPSVQDPVSAALAAEFASLDSPSVALQRLKDAIARGAIGDHRALAESLLRHPLVHFRQEALGLLLPAWAEREPEGLLRFLGKFREDEIWLLWGDPGAKTAQLREQALRVWAGHDAMAALRFAMEPANRRTFQDALDNIGDALFAQGNPMEQARRVRDEWGEALLPGLLSYGGLDKLIDASAEADLEEFRDTSTNPWVRHQFSWRLDYKRMLSEQRRLPKKSSEEPSPRQAPRPSHRTEVESIIETLNLRTASLEQVPELFASQSPAFQEQWRLPVVAGLAKQQPAHAAELWLQAGEHELAAPGAAVVAEEIAERYLRQDSEAASAWIGQLPPGSGRDRAVARMIERVAALDPETSAQWAATLADPDAQARAAAALQRAGSSTSLPQ